MKKQSKTIRQVKPRTQGVTMVMDKGLGVHAFTDWAEMVEEYVDFVKLGFGTARLLKQAHLTKKQVIAKQCQINLYPGGTLFEYYAAQNKVERYFELVIQWGFSWIEISDGSYSFSKEQREKWIKAAKEKGLHVITEIGKKEAGVVIPWKDCCTQYRRDLDAGADYVIIEGRESGMNIGMYDQNGELDHTYVQQIIKQVGGERMIWEAPLKKQQVALLHLIGQNVNLGNIAPDEALSVEALRHGLRADTFGWW
ncbi:phosphosulfolactate synthase [Seinonella peptonophila]|nr:phosphosulfolactate synthase [Seinonella peptonophila]